MNRSLFARVLAPCLMMASLAVTPATAQISKLKEAVKAEVERGTISPEAAKAISAEISPSPTDKRGVGLRDPEWDIEFAMPGAPNGQPWTSLRFLEVQTDVEGNLIANGRGQTASDSYTFFAKFDPTTGLNTLAGVNQPWAVFGGVSGGSRGFQLDLEGNVYYLTSPLNQEPRRLRKLSGETGSQQWQVDLFTDGTLSGGPDLVVDGDGNVYVIYISTVQSDGTPGRALGVQRYRSDGSRVFSRIIADFDENAVLLFDNAIDRFGNIYVAYNEFTAAAPLGVGRLTKINAAGDAEWIETLDGLVEGNVVVDFDCNSYIAEFLDSVSRVNYALNSFTTDGERRFRKDGSVGPGIAILFLSVTRDSQIYVGRDFVSGTQQPLIDQFSQSGFMFGTHSVSFPLDQDDRVDLRGLDVDRFGNPYILLDLRRDLVTNDIYISKLDKRNIAGERSWIYQFPRGSDTGQTDFAFDILVDFGDNVYMAGRIATDPDGPGPQPNLSYCRLAKLSQPFTSVPTIARNSPSIQVENQSIWSAGQGSISAETTFFNETVPFDITLSALSGIPVVGEFGGSVNAVGSAQFGLGFEAIASGGTADVSYPGELDIAVAGIDKLEPGAPFPVRIQFDADPGARVTADVVPQLSAGVVADLGMNIGSSASLIALSSEFASFPLFDGGASYDGPVPGLFFEVPTGNPGSWVELSDEAGFFSAKLTRPQFATSGGYNANNGRAVSTLEPETFLELRANISNMVAAAAGLTLGKDIGAPDPANSEWSFGAGFAVAQLFTQVDLEANQTIEYEPSPEVVLDFSFPVVINNGEFTGTQYRTVLERDGSTWAEDITITASPANLLANNYTLSVTPRLEAPGTMSNRTWVTMVPSVGWETLAIAANAQGFGETLFGFEACVGCFDIASFDLDIALPTLTFPVPALSEPVPSFALDPIQIVIEPDENADPAYPGQPRISGTSRRELKAFLVNQFSPTVQEFNEFLNRDPSRMLIYGDLFNATGDYELDSFVLCVGGRVFDLPIINENMPGMPLNSRTALVEIPNEARLIPAVARIWAQNADNEPISDSVDFPISLPAPNLVAAGPSVWAEDPRVGGSLEVSLTDGLTPLGGPSFIARRDYWNVLSDLWNNSNLTSGSLASSYPTFDFLLEPPIPSVMIERDDIAVLPGTISQHRFEGTLDSDSISNTQTSGDPEYTDRGVPTFLGQAIEIPSSSGLTVQVFGTGSDFIEPELNDFSAAVWVKKVAGLPSNDTYVDSTPGSDEMLGFIMYANVRGNPGVRLTTNSASPVVDEFVLEGFQYPAFETGQWHHFAFTVDRDQPDGLRLYLDGVLIGAYDPTPYSDEMISTRSMYFGSSFFGGGSGGTNPNTGDFTDGRIADFTVYDRALNRDQILFLANPTEATPVSRLSQSFKNGQLFATLPVGEYDEPDIKGFRLRSPGPGGGLSTRANLIVAAPEPVISNLIPRAVLPGNGDFVLTVEGPFNVPTFDGFQEPRFGNFNKASVVLWNGMELDTKYVTPGTLRAIVPAELTNFQGSAQVSVYTPSNGTQYFDSFAGGQGEPGFNVDSGGESNSIGFDIRYPQPVIMALQPEYATRALINRCADVPGEIRLQVTGRHIVPGAVIWFNGAPLETFVQANKANGIFINGVQEEALSDDVIFAFLGVGDLEPALEAAGVATITVVNPDGSASETALLDIVDQATYEMLSGVTLPEQTLPGEPCDD